MLVQLQQMFPNLTKATEESSYDSAEYKWFITKDNEIIGIPASDLSDREKELLEILLTPYFANEPPTNAREKKWMDVLFHHEIPRTLMEDSFEKYYFVYFSFSDDTVDPEAFREAIYGLFPVQIPILWENNHEGILIIEGEQTTDEDISYSEIIEVLTTDFYMNIQLFIGPTLYHITEAAKYYQWLKKCYKLTKSQNREVMYYIKAIPYLVMQHLSDEEKHLLYHSILHTVIEEEELLKTIQVFLESNSNTTLAAKKMFMHRNSLQYRVDKFIEKTGIDVKKFDGALAVYLCLILRTQLA
ncbi:MULTISPECIES: PucR family transcriptional regulator [Gracilibacillus]|uniref:PucR C-terminal helix-turn-helix domain-containing protein n=1 Tax=Gracilibacillus dipsosauri TaxID=178340 RepID=A0A317KTZ2_9BACI|nr:helix-turn-helix domain-containing protein [Gracilibacillus dipsosauri]PWU66776.1 hypothetical protein DLJ74_18045 [Gracilibacillus dipsosauri]